MQIVLVFLTVSEAKFGNVGVIPVHTSNFWKCLISSLYDQFFCEKYQSNHMINGTLEKKEEMKNLVIESIQKWSYEIREKHTSTYVGLQINMSLSDLLFNLAQYIHNIHKFPSYV